MRSRYAVHLLILLLPMIVVGNDGYSAFTSNGIVFGKTEKISLESEVLSISPDLISITYIFKNETAENIEATLAFPFPPIKCSWFEETHLPEKLYTKVNGIPIELKKEIRAKATMDTDHFKKGDDVTDFLLEHGLPINCMDIPECNDVRTASTKRGVSSTAHQKLVDLGLAWPLGSDPLHLPYDSVVKYYWDQMFPANEQVRIYHQYVPHTGSVNGYYGADKMSSMIAQNLDMYQNLYRTRHPKGRGGDSFEFGAYSYLDYILTTANTWSGPIKNFTLIIKDSGKLSVPSLNMKPTMINGEVKLSMKNFEPKDELRIVFFD